jgi:hypothetical protein
MTHNGSKDRLFRIRDMVEKPKASAPSNLAIIGRYVLTPEIFDCIAEVQPGSGGNPVDRRPEVSSAQPSVYAYRFEAPAMTPAISWGSSKRRCNSRYAGTISASLPGVLERAETVEWSSDICSDGSARKARAKPHRWLK